MGPLVGLLLAGPGMRCMEEQRQRVQELERVQELVAALA